MRLILKQNGRLCPYYKHQFRTGKCTRDACAAISLPTSVTIMFLHIRRVTAAKHQRAVIHQTQ